MSFSLPFRYESHTLVTPSGDWRRRGQGPRALTTRISGEWCRWSGPASAGPSRGELHRQQATGDRGQGGEMKHPLGRYLAVVGTVVAIGLSAGTSSALAATQSQ